MTVTDPTYDETQVAEAQVDETDETVTVPEGEGALAMAEADAKADGTKRQMPTYGLQKVTELPDNVPSSRADIYFNLLTQVADDPGEWYEIAHFKTPTGAASVAKDLKDGKRNIPKGEWEFQARKVPATDGEGNVVVGPKHSKLFAHFMG